MFPLNLPNALTLVRILLVPVLVVALTVESPGGSTIAAIVFAVAALTDGLDGYIARSRQAVTTFGKVMDPVADKLMIAAALISLVSLDRLAGLGGDGDHRARVRGQRPADRRRPAGRGHPGQRARQAEDDRPGGGGAGPDRGVRPPRRLGAGARLRDGARDGRVRRRLLPELPAQAGAGVALARRTQTTCGSSRLGRLRTDAQSWWESLVARRSESSSRLVPRR